MSIHVFTDEESRSRRMCPEHFPPHLRRLISGTKDSIEALRAFRALIIEEDYQHSFLEFDSHCGDSACQLRPVALHQVLTRARNAPELFCADLDKTINSLQSLHDEALRVHRLLCDDGLSMEELMGKQLSKCGGVSRNEYYTTLGLDNWFQALDQSPAMYTASAMNFMETSISSSSSEPASTSGAKTPLDHFASSDGVPVSAKELELVNVKVKEMGMLEGYIQNKCTDLAHLADVPQNLSPSLGSHFSGNSSNIPITTMGKRPPPSKSQNHSSRRKTSIPIWNISEWFTIVQFLVYSFRIGRYKQVISAPDCSAFIYRLAPQIAWEAAQGRDREELACKYKKGRKRCPWRNCQDATWSTIDQEFKTIQIWICQITVSLVQSLCTSPNLPRKLKDVARETIRQSPGRPKSVIPTFLTFVAVRQYWFDAQVPLFLVIQRFCSEGYHFHWVRLVPKSHSSVENIPSRKYTLEYIQPNKSDNEWQKEFHICTIANSMVDTANSAQDLVRIQVSGGCRPRPHKGNGCADDIHFRERLAKTDFDEVYSTFFAQHSNYPFDVKPVSTPINEFTILLDPLEHSLARHDFFEWNVWQKTLSERARAIGSSYDAMGLCVIEHIFADTPEHLKSALTTCWVKDELVLLPGFIRSTNSQA